MSSLAQSILTIAQSLPDGGLLSPKEFLHLGSRAAVAQTLSRLSRAGQLLRVGRGAYALPVTGRFGARPPSTESVVEAIEARTGETVVASGAAEANALGLTTQVPAREVFLTSGRSRRIRLGQREIEHAPHWQLASGKRPAGQAVRALAWLGPDRAPEALKQLREVLTSEEWQALCQIRASLPSWMVRLVGGRSIPLDTLLQCKFLIYQ
jgi:hypothetical protein